MNTAGFPDPHQPLSQDERALLSAWLDGECSDVGQIRTLLDRSTEARQYLEQLRQARELYHAGRGAVLSDPEAAVADILRRICADTGSKGRVLQTFPKRPGAPWWWAAAAAVLLVAAGGTFFQLVHSTPGAYPDQTFSKGSSVAAETVIGEVDLTDLLAETFMDTSALADLWENLPEEDLLLYAALWEEDTIISEGPEDTGLWWEQAERLAALFDSTETGGSGVPGPQTMRVIP